MRRADAVAAFCVLAAALSSPVPRALADFPSVRDTGGHAAWRLARSDATWGVEVAELRHWGIDGLRTAGARLRFGGSRWRAGVEAVATSSVIGSESVLGVWGGRRVGPRTSVAVACNVDEIDVGATPAYAWSGSWNVRVDFGERVTLFAAADRIAFGRTDDPGGADVDLCLRVAAAGTTVDARARLDRLWGASFHGDVGVRLGNRVTLALGYSDDTEALRAAVSVGAAGVSADAGVIEHPVLGRSDGVALRWAR